MGSLYKKFRVERMDGSSAPGGKHEGCDYLVLDWRHDPYAVRAALAYAAACEKDHPALARDIRIRAALADDDRMRPVMVSGMLAEEHVVTIRQTKEEAASSTKEEAASSAKEEAASSTKEEAYFADIEHVLERLDSFCESMNDRYPNDERLNSMEMAIDSLAYAVRAITREMKKQSGR